ncbi:hypothetical protein L4D06_25000 [Enterovibrio makurazakiensis]|uniref:hypothetical protein n=1 Tax=Enterovibrio makurazakiensis TaxID=2910232 RepID=UPI003D1D301D
MPSYCSGNAFFFHFSVDTFAELLGGVEAVAIWFRVVRSDVGYGFVIEKRWKDKAREEF